MLTVLPKTMFCKNLQLCALGVVRKNGPATVECKLAVSSKANCPLPKDTALALLSIHAKEMENSDHRKAWIQMFKADFSRNLKVETGNMSFSE